MELAMCTIGSIDGNYESDEFLDPQIQALPSWFGRSLTWDDFPDLLEVTKQRIGEFIDSDPQLLYKLAWIGSTAPQRPHIQREYAHFLKSQDDWSVEEAGITKTLKKGAKSTWKGATKLAKKTYKAAEAFWEENKNEIIIGATIAATAVATAAIIVSTGGAGTEAALAGGSALVNSLIASTYGTAPPTCEIPLASIPLPAPKPPPPITSSPPTPQPPKPTEPKLTLQWLYPPLESDPSTVQLYQHLSENTPLPAENSLRAPENDSFVGLIEKKLTEAKAPDYLERVPPFPKRNTDFIAQLEACIYEKARTKYEVGMRRVEETLADKGLRDWASQLDNYACMLSLNKPKAPFFEVPLLGAYDQGTVHYHCGINNDFDSVADGGFRLRDSLEDSFAVQPHLLHSNNLLKGLAFVQLEKVTERSEMITREFLVSLPGPFEIPGFFLRHSAIERSIKYEVETLSRIAENILEKNNPNLKQVHVAFSNGAYVFKEALKRLTPEQRDTIVVITTGATALIENDLACEVLNIIGDKDWPSLHCNGGKSGVEFAKRNGVDVQMIEQNEKPFCGHFFTQDEYQEKIAEFIEDKKRQYETY